MHLEYLPLRGAFWLTLVLALEAISQHALGSDRSIPEVCRQWPQSRLLIGAALQSRRFVLEAKGEVQRLPTPAVPGARFVYHRTFGLSLDVPEPIALYYTDAAKVCVVERSPQTAKLLRIPVFFVGHPAQSLDDLKVDAERAAFAPSGRLSAGESFGEVRFYLRKGASRFDEIRPFFMCGLPGLMLCEGYCPGDAAAFVQSLVSSVTDKAEGAPSAGLSGNATQCGGKCWPRHHSSTGMAAVLIHSQKSAPAGFCRCSAEIASRVARVGKG
jgi:hypothetical protein